MIEIKEPEEPVTIQSKTESAPEKSFAGIPLKDFLIGPFTAVAEGEELLRKLKEQNKPLLSSVPIPPFKMDDVSVDFTMDVKESNKVEEI